MAPEDNNNLLSSEEINDLLEQESASSSNDALDEKLEMILEFPLEVSVRIGETRMNIAELLSLTTGNVIEFSRVINEPVDLVINGKLVARGEVVTVGENFAIKITSIITPEERVKQLG